MRQFERRCRTRPKSAQADRRCPKYHRLCRPGSSLRSVRGGKIGFGHRGTGGRGKAAGTATAARSQISR